MPIRWKTLPIWDMMDEVQTLIDKLTPSLKAMSAKVDATRTEQDYLAGYMDCHLRGLMGSLASALSNAKSTVDTIRHNLPAAALAKERLSQQQTLGILAERVVKATSSRPYVSYQDERFAARVHELQNPKPSAVVGTQTILGGSSVAVAEPDGDYEGDEDEG